MTRNLGGRPRQMPTDDTSLQLLAEKYLRLGTIRALVSDTGYAYGTIQRNLQIAQARGFVQVNARGGARVVPNAAELRAKSG